MHLHFRTVHPRPIWKGTFHLCSKLASQKHTHCYFLCCSVEESCSWNVSSWLAHRRKITGFHIGRWPTSRLMSVILSLKLHIRVWKCCFVCSLFRWDSSYQAAHMKPSFQHDITDGNHSRQTLTTIFDTIFVWGGLKWKKTNFRYSVIRASDWCVRIVGVTAPKYTVSTVNLRKVHPFEIIITVAVLRHMMIIGMILTFFARYEACGDMRGIYTWVPN